MEGDRALVRLTQVEAELALIRLTGNVRDRKDPLAYKTWEVVYSGGIVPCTREEDAKLLARELVKKGYKVSARTIEGLLPARSVTDHQIYAWLVE